MELRVESAGISFNTEFFEVQQYLPEYGWIKRVGHLRSREAAEDVFHNIVENNGELKLIGGDFTRPIEKTAEAIREHFATGGHGISLYGFASKEEAQAVAAKFPKYAKVRAGTCTGSDFMEYNIPCKLDSVSKWGMEFLAYGVSISIDRVSKVTGDANETGNKRVEAYIKGLQAQGFIQ